MFYDFASLLPRKSLDHEIDDDFLFTFFFVRCRRRGDKLPQDRIMCLMNHTFDLNKFLKLMGDLTC